MNIIKIDNNKFNMNKFVTTLSFILVKSTLDLFPEATIILKYSLNKGIFGEITKENPLTEEEILKIKEKMREIINRDIVINKIAFNKNDAIDLFEKYHMKDKVKLLKYCLEDKVVLYELEGLIDYFQGEMEKSTGVSNNFDLIKYENGFILRFPREDYTEELPTYEDTKKISKVLYESKKWAEILEVEDVGALNEIIENNEINELIRINEALQEKKIANIADMVKQDENIKIVLVAGPSSSGKTTFTKRLSIQLRAAGLKPMLISLDDYFVNRECTPKDEKGNYDFESIHALDLELFNFHLKKLLNHEEVEIPEFNFKYGRREWKNKNFKMPEDGIILIEGIHGLNEILSSSIERKNKFKIYVSCLAQINIDNHNRISTTDARIIRRIVRDSISRGLPAERTLKMWYSIKNGEEKNIFVFQEESDAIFNSSLVYELGVLKEYAIKELDTICKNSEVYIEACRLKLFLKLFRQIDKELVPDNSLLREFVGESCFYNY